MAATMISCTNLLIGCAALFLLVVAVSGQGNYGYDVTDNSMNVPDKRMANSACYSCMHNHMDMVSCGRCFGGLGTVPFYGSFIKRSYPNHQMTSSPAYEMMKRGPANFLVCRCCMYLESWDCCYNCAFGIYYGKRSPPMLNTPFPVAKRNYFTSFTGMNGGSGVCSCCDMETFDYFCCATRCSRRRRK